MRRALLILLGATLLLAGAAEARTLKRVLVTEYYAVPETWFDGELVTAPGLDGPHAVDWLYGGRGVSMEGTGVGRDGQTYHLCDGFQVGWVTEDGRPTTAASGFSQGSPFWRAGGYWLTRAKKVTYRLQSGGWAKNGTGVKEVPAKGQRFCSGDPRELVAYQNVAVDPEVIPLGSRVFIPYYKRLGLDDGWFVAADTGGAINGRHIDVYVPPPATPFGPARSLRGQTIKVYKPRRTLAGAR